MFITFEHNLAPKLVCKHSFSKTTVWLCYMLWNCFSRAENAVFAKCCKHWIPCHKTTLNTICHHVYHIWTQSDTETCLETLIFKKCNCIFTCSETAFHRLKTLFLRGGEACEFPHKKWLQTPFAIIFITFEHNLTTCTCQWSVVRTHGS